MPTTSRPSRYRHHTPQRGRLTREGRALVECIVAALLLSIATLALASTTRSTLALADDSALVSRAQSLATTRAEDALANHCPTHAGQDLQQRLTFDWQQTSSGNTTLLHLNATLDRSPIALNNHTQLTFTLESGGVCQ